MEAWRTRELGTFLYVMLDARYEKLREGGVVRDAAVLSAIGIDKEGKRRILGVSVKLSEAEVHWRDFLDSLVARGLRGVTYVVSDDHSGLNAARKAVLAGATWQRCPFPLAQNAIPPTPNQTTQKQIGAELRRVWNADNLDDAKETLKRLVESYAKTAPDLASWLEANVPEGLAVFSLPEPHRRRLRTSNLMERAIQQEIKRRTAKIRVFPSQESLLRLVSAILAEIDDEWAGNERRYISWENQDV
ncbi:MAG: IS256 family transposase [Geminicoccaceae bacterium]